jgi:8-oxoguanine deaminase
MSDHQGGVTPANLTQTDEVILADSERVLRRYHDAADGAMIQIALAPCSPFNVTKHLLRESAALAEQHGCRLHTQLR